MIIMTQLTYTIAHIRVGAEKPYVEIHGYINNTGGQLLTSEAFVNIMNGNSFTTGYEPRNVDHFLSPLAEKLGAKIYGGFDDERDFYVVMPTTREKIKVGDIVKNDFSSRILRYGNYVLEKNNFNQGFCWLLTVGGEVASYDYRIAELFLSENDFFQEYRIAEFFLSEDNIFQEYAKTGIIENELYKQFFK